MGQQCGHGHYISEAGDHEREHGLGQLSHCELVESNSMALTGAGSLPLQKEKLRRVEDLTMPIGKYFKGNGDKVMDSMKKSNGGDPDAAKREFYATANAHPENKPASSRRKKGKAAKPGLLGSRLRGMKL